MMPPTRPPPGSSALGDAPVVHQEGRGGAGMINALGTVGAAVVVLGTMGLPTVRATSAGLSHTCTLVIDNTIKCWGSNSLGQLGHNDTTVRGTAEADMSMLPIVELGSDFSPTDVYSGENYNCALGANGGIKCWGHNSDGQLGLADTDQRGGLSSVPEMGDDLPYVDLGLPEGETVEMVGCSDKHTCAVTTAGGIKCWGFNDGGQLGYENTKDVGTGPGEMGDLLPYVDIGIDTDLKAVAVALGFKHTCALVSNGGVKCWGNNSGGQLGYEDTVGRGGSAGTMGANLSYVPLGRDQTALAIAAGAFHSCALLNTGSVKCWGFAADGQLGQGNNASIGTSAGSMGDNISPIDLGEDRTALAISAGAVHTCAVLDDNTVKCWGNNERGTLGLGDTVFRGDKPGQMGDNLPHVDLTFGKGKGKVADVYAGTFHNCVSGTRGGIACFGINQYGQLGVGNNMTYGDEPGEVNLLKSISVGNLPVKRDLSDVDPTTT